MVVSTTTNDKQTTFLPVPSPLTPHFVIESMGPPEGLIHNFQDDSDLFRQMAQACMEGDVDAVEQILSMPSEYGHAGGGGGAYDCSIPIPWIDANQRAFQKAPIFIAVDYGHEALIPLLLRGPARSTGTFLETIDDPDNTNDAASSFTSLVNCRDDHNFTPLHWACWSGNLSMAQTLIDHGAVVDQEALDWAKEGNHTELVTLLLQHATDLYSSLQDDAHAMFIKACRLGDVVMVRSMIERGYDWNDERQEYNPLAIAMRNGNIDVVQILQEHGGAIVDWDETNNVTQPMADHVDRSTLTTTYPETDEDPTKAMPATDHTVTISTDDTETTAIETAASDNAPADDVVISVAYQES